MELKNDKYRKARGGCSKFLEISCAKCERSLFIYQKDGPGPLKRAYVDRIIKSGFVKSKTLDCKNCGAMIGTLYLYKKESRPAYRLYHDSVLKKVVKKSDLS